MTNFEFWKEEILEITRENNNISVACGEPRSCACTRCSRCELYDGAAYCVKPRFDWLYAEHVEKPKLTKKERQFCELAGRGYIARDADGELDWYSEEPYKKYDCWYSDVIKNTCNIDKLFNVDNPFPFITWDDKEPWSVKDLLKLEVKEEE